VLKVEVEVICVRGQCTSLLATPLFCSVQRALGNLNAEIMKTLSTHVSAIVSVLQRFNKIKPDLVSAKRVETNCSNIEESFVVLDRELDGSFSRASAAVGLYADAGLLKLLVPFLIRMQGCAVADMKTNPCGQLCFQLWARAMDLLYRVMTLSNQWHEKLPMLSRKVARAILPESPIFPGEQQEVTNRIAHTQQLHPRSTRPHMHCVAG
jgi:hypothetical protein